MNTVVEELTKKNEQLQKDAAIAYEWAAQYCMAVDDLMDEVSMWKALAEIRIMNIDDLQFELGCERVRVNVLQNLRASSMERATKRFKEIKGLKAMLACAEKDKARLFSECTDLLQQNDRLFNQCVILEQRVAQQDGLIESLDRQLLECRMGYNRR